MCVSVFVKDTLTHTHTQGLTYVIKEEEEETVFGRLEIILNVR